MKKIIRYILSVLGIYVSLNDGWLISPAGWLSTLVRHEHGPAPTQGSGWCLPVGRCSPAATCRSRTIASPNCQPPTALAPTLPTASHQVATQRSGMRDPQWSHSLAISLPLEGTWVSLNNFSFLLVRDLTRNLTSVSEKRTLVKLAFSFLAWFCISASVGIGDMCWHHRNLETRKFCPFLVQMSLF